MKRPYFASVILLASIICGASSAASAADKLLWENWYTVTLNGNIHYEYYNERVELKKGKLYFLNHVWKKEDDAINEEQLGAFAESNPDLTPLFYNFHSTYRTTETTIDGNIKDGKLFTAKVRKGGADLPLVKRNIPSRVFLSVFFPVWLGYRLPDLKPGGKTISFSTLLEDGVDNGFSPVVGEIREEKPDEIAQKTKSRRLLVNLGSKQIWWVDERGAAVRIETPERGMVVERVSKDRATKFLDAAPASAPSSQ